MDFIRVSNSFVFNRMAAFQLANYVFLNYFHHVGANNKRNSTFIVERVAPNTDFSTEKKA